MSTSSVLHSNPFALLLDPSAVLAACQKSKPLSALRNAIHRPLDKPKVFLDTAAAEYDAAIDAGLPIAVAMTAQADVVSPAANDTAAVSGPSTKAPSIAVASSKAVPGRRKTGATQAAAAAYEVQASDAGALVLSGGAR